MRAFLSILAASLALLVPVTLAAYTLPIGLNLGFTSFLDGGVGPATPGFTFQQYVQYYESHKFLGPEGEPLPGLGDPDFDAYISITQFLYTTNIDILKGKLGFNCIVPYVFDARIKDNPLDIKSSGGGFGDLFFATYIQWDTIMNGDDPVMSNRLECNVSFPTGKVRKPEFSINPGANCYYITPYWAATLFFTPKLSASWRLHYLWCGKDHTTHVQAGQSVFTNYSLEYQFQKNFYVGLNGYYLQQFQNSKFNNKPIPKSRERVFAIGPGVLVIPNQSLNLFLNLYFESYVKNRPEGYRLNMRAMKFF